MKHGESDIIIPALSLLRDAGGDGLTTTELKERLGALLELSEEDNKILEGRSDTHFSQIVRNLVSHKTLVKKGLAVFNDEESRHKITAMGMKYLSENSEAFEYIIKDGFDESQRKQIIDDDFRNLVIEEGQGRIMSVKSRTRSRKLVEAAKRHFSNSGKLYCCVCSFCYEDFYGETGAGYIEIHHLKPISYSESAEQKTIEDALKNVAPVCASCHRMIHRSRGKIISIEELSEIVRRCGVYNRATKG